MSRFNQKVQPQRPNTVNHEGGLAYTLTLEKEITSILLTSFMNDKFYEKADDTATRLTQLIQRCNTEQLLFVAKSLIYARTVFGMRSITHIGTAALAPLIGGQPWARKFYEKITYRVDDMTEILSLIGPFKGPQGNKVPNAIRRAFAKRLTEFTPYQLAKYRGENKTFKLVDVVNLVRPKETEGIQMLMTGRLKNEDTWEAMLSAAGNDPVKKADVWLDLITGHKLGYLALLRNLRNIYEQAPYTLPYAVESLTDEAFIKKSMILPFQFVTAYDELNKLLPTPELRILLTAISKAVDISLANVPVFEGRTVVVLDVSSSMTQIMKTGQKTPAEIGSLFAAVLAKANNADLITFDHFARHVSVSHELPALHIAKQIEFKGGGTRFDSFFPIMGARYDRVIVLSDMQGWNAPTFNVGGGNTFQATISNYRKKFGIEPVIYSFDLNGYGTMQTPESKTFLLAGFSDKIFDVMKKLEEDRNALINTISAIEL